MTPLSERTWYRVFACMLAMLVSIGLVRYAYSPLVPGMIEHGWISSAQTGYLGTVNFCGNILGAILCGMLARRFTSGRICRWALLIGFISVGLSALDFGAWWLGGCRFIAGLTAAGGMILAPALVTQGVPPEDRGKLMGLTFAGSGLGVILLSLTLPLLPNHDPTTGWLYTAVLILVCIVLAWPGLKTHSSVLATSETKPKSTTHRNRLILLAICYFFAAAAIVPHSIYLAAYLNIQLHEPIGFSMMIYAVYGVGICIGGPLLDGLITPWIGRYLGLALAMAIGLTGLLMLVLTTSVWITMASAFVVGVSQMGFASLITHRILALAGQAGHIKWWGILTIVFNISMALAAFAMGYMVHLGWGFLAGFWMGAGCFAMALLFALITTAPKGIGQGEGTT